jgi:hypothetical protein
MEAPTDLMSTFLIQVGNLTATAATMLLQQPSDSGSDRDRLSLWQIETSA